MLGQALGLVVQLLQFGVDGLNVQQESLLVGRSF
jgi:hypothetical protein